MIVLLFSLVPVKKILQGKRVSCVQYVTAFAALIFALNMEQSMIILFGLDILMLGYTFWWLPSQENKTVLEGRCFFILRAVIEIVSVIFTFTFRWFEKWRWDFPQRCSILFFNPMYCFAFFVSACVPVFGCDVRKAGCV